MIQLTTLKQYFTFNVSQFKKYTSPFTVAFDPSHSPIAQDRQVLD